jgi:hypothetical protein
MLTRVKRCIRFFSNSFRRQLFIVLSPKDVSAADSYVCWGHYPKYAAHHESTRVHPGSLDGFRLQSRTEIYVGGKGEIRLLF